MRPGDEAHRTTASRATRSERRRRPREGREESLRLELSLPARRAPGQPRTWRHAARLYLGMIFSLTKVAGVGLPSFPAARQYADIFPTPAREPRANAAHSH